MALTLPEKLRLFADEYKRIFPLVAQAMKIDGELTVVHELLHQAADKIEEADAKPRIGRPPKDKQADKGIA